MAPRKKRGSKSQSARKPKTTPKSPEHPTEAPEPQETEPKPVTPPLPIETTRPAVKSHKSFGKFRCLHNEMEFNFNSKPVEMATETEVTTEAVVSAPIAEVEMFEAVYIPIEEAGEVVVGGDESSSEAAFVQPESEAQSELTEQLSRLEVQPVEPVVRNVSPIVGGVEIVEYEESVYSDTGEEGVCNDFDDESDVPEVDEEEDASEEQKPLKTKAHQEKQKLSKAEKIKKDLEMKLLQGSNSDGSSPSEGSIRRSTRIKTINVLKQRSKGRGLVKTKCESNSPKNLDSDMSENSNSADMEKSKPEPSVTKEAEHKPVKVKSRWRRSSELEMSSNSPVVSSPPTTTDSSLSTVSSEKRDCDGEVDRRLKQFIHLKENQYLTDRISCKEAKKMTCDCFLTSEEVERGEYGCGEDCLNRLLMIECGNLCPLGDRCTNKRFQKTQFAPCEVFNTDKKGLGIRAKESIPYGEFILEYVGEVLDPDEFENRATEYSKDKNQHYYFMSLRSDAVIDATLKGNISRFINHSCDPNAETQKWTVNGELRIGFFSKRTILPGEEITFDYQFQRYGKEAQKCFCEAPTCRGWLGEEPDEDDEEDDEDDEEEEEEQEQHAETTSRKYSSVSDCHVKEKAVKREKKVPKRRTRKERFEVMSLDDEIENLAKTGLKNQAHTLTLTRLLIRAKDPPQRSKLLKLLRHGELPCRRLFLDYHGLRLIHVWMTEVQHLVKEDKKFESLRLEILQTLAVLPIPNKTMLQDSKVLCCVEKWSVSENEKSPPDSSSNSPIEEEIKPEEPVEVKTEEKEEDAVVIIKGEFDEELVISEIRKSVGMEVENRTPKLLPFPKLSGRKLIEHLSTMFEEEDVKKEAEEKSKKPSGIPLDFDYEVEIVALALKLLEEWASLKEVFRIPKKERIEQMKEHEREANRKYKALLGLEQENERKIANRYRNLPRYRPPDKPEPTDRARKPPPKPEERPPLSQINKHERRMLFAMKVEHEEERKRLKQRELWLLQQEQQLKERQRALLAAEPRFPAPFESPGGFQLMWNQQLGQWQNVPVQTASSYGMLPGVSPIVSKPPESPVLPNFSSYLAHMDPQTLVNVPTVLQNQLPSQVVQTIPPPLPQAPPPRLPSMLPNMSQLNPPLPKPNPPLLPQSVQIRPPLPVATPPIIPHQQPPIIPPLPATPYKEASKREDEDPTQVKFMGPIPPPVKLPPKWKCAKDRYGRPYYYHVKVRTSQWEPPEFPPPPSEIAAELSDSSSSSDSSSVSSESSSEETDSDDEIDDTKLMLNIKGKLAAKSAAASAETVAEAAIEGKEMPQRKSSIDERLKELILGSEEEGEAIPTPVKKRRAGLVQEIIISPRTEEDRLQFKEDLKRIKENKEMLKRQKELALQQMEAKKSVAFVKRKSVKSKIKEIVMDMDSDAARKIKESFRTNMAGVIVSVLNSYRKQDCKEARITNTDDFKHLARKLTHFVMLKEIKHCEKIEELTCTENVKIKAKEFVRKYMSKFGKVYQRPKDDADY